VSRTTEVLTPEAKREIVDLLYRYATAIDEQDWTMLRTCWTDDCEVAYDDVGSWTGGDEITAFMEKVHKNCDSLHRITNPTAWTDGERVRARSYIDGVVMRGEARVMHAIGSYEDEVVPTPDGWRIARRHYRKLHMRIGPVAEVL
jgi:3-phenylpropionate/cinnamic acid dioxygenase small subunit